MTKLYNQDKLKEIRKKLRRQDIGAEKVLWQKIRNRQQKYKFRRQYSIGQYVVDFYCPKIKLAIEVDGGTHSTAGEIKRDKNKQIFLEKLGIVVKRYNNIDVYKNISDVLTDIYIRCEELKTSPRPLLGKEREAYLKIATALAGSRPQ
jgi:very-short-patch-repair endonuclease